MLIKIQNNGAIVKILKMSFDSVIVEIFFYFNCLCFDYSCDKARNSLK